MRDAGRGDARRWTIGRSRGAGALDERRATVVRANARAETMGEMRVVCCLARSRATVVRCATATRVKIAGAREATIVGATSSYWSEEAMNAEKETVTEIETTETRVRASDGYVPFDDDDEDDVSRADAGKRALGAAAIAAAIAAFAYSDASVSVPILAPAQTLARALVDMVAAGVDSFVDIMLDAYDAAILGCINVFAWTQSFLLTPGGVVSSGAKASSNLIADPSGAIAKVLGLLSAKPFMSIAAVLLTLSRVVASWTFAAAEYACALLYAMPVYVAAPLAVVSYLTFKKRAMTRKVVEEKKSLKKLANAKAKASAIVSEGKATGASAKWAERLAANAELAKTTPVASAAYDTITEYSSSMSSSFSSSSSDVNVVDPYSLSPSDYSSNFSSDYSYSSSGDAPLDLSPVNYDKYSSNVSSGMSRSSGSALPSGFGLYDFEESYSNREALMGGYNIDQAEVERIYAELMPKDAGIPVPVFESKSETVVEEVKETSAEEDTDAAAAFMRQASTSGEQTKPAAVTESKVTEQKAESVTTSTSTSSSTTSNAPVTEQKTESVTTSTSTSSSTTSNAPVTETMTSKMEMSKIASSSESTKGGKKGGSKEAFLGFVDKVSSIKPEDVTNVVKSVTKKENLDKAAELAKEAANKVQARLDAVEGGNAPKLPGGTRRVSPQDDDFGEGTMIRKKK